MDFAVAVDRDGGQNVEFDRIERVKPIENTNFINLLYSPVKQGSRKSSLDSEYAIVSDITIEDSDSEKCFSEVEGNLDLCYKSKLKEPYSAGSIKNSSVQDPSDCTEMDEFFVIVDDDVSNEKSDIPASTSDSKHRSLSDGEDSEMDDIIAEFAEEEKKKKTVIQLSDNEDEIDFLLDEFAETQSKENNVILSSDNEDEMECLLEEFSKNISDDESTSQKEKLVKAEPISNHTEKSKVHLSDNSKISINCDVIIKAESDKVKQFSGANPKLHCNDSKLNSKTSLYNTKNDDCIILCDSDEVSNEGSIEIITLDDFPVKEIDLNKPINNSAKDSLNKNTGEELPSPVKHESQKLNFGNELLEIVDEVEPEFPETDFTNLIINTKFTKCQSSIDSSSHMKQDLNASIKSSENKSDGITSVNENLSSIEGIKNCALKNQSKQVENEQLFNAEILSAESDTNSNDTKPDSAKESKLDLSTVTKGFLESLAVLAKADESPNVLSQTVLDVPLDIPEDSASNLDTKSDAQTVSNKKLKTKLSTVDASIGDISLDKPQLLLLNFDSCNHDISDIGAKTASIYIETKLSVAAKPSELPLSTEPSITSRPPELPIATMSPVTVDPSESPITTKPPTASLSAVETEKPVDIEPTVATETPFETESTVTVEIPFKTKLAVFAETSIETKTAVIETPMKTKLDVEVKMPIEIETDVNIKESVETETAVVTETLIDSPMEIETHVKIKESVETETAVVTETLIDLPMEIEADVKNKDSVETETAVVSETLIDLPMEIETDVKIKESVETKTAVVTETLIETESTASTETPIEIIPAFTPETHIETEPNVDAEAPIEMKPVFNNEACLEIEPTVVTETPIETETAVATEKPSENKPEYEIGASIETEIIAVIGTPVETESTAATETPINTKPDVESESPVETKPGVNIETSREIEPTVAAEIPIEIETTFATEIPIEIETTVATENPIKTKPDIEIEASIETESTVDTETLIKIKPDVDIESSIKIKPAVVAEEPIQTKLDVNIETSLEIEPTVGPGKPIEDKPDVEIESVTIAAIETTIQTKPDVETETIDVIETPIETELTVVTETPIKTKPDAEIESSIETEPAVLTAVSIETELTEPGVTTESQIATKLTITNKSTISTEIIEPAESSIATTSNIRTASPITAESSIPNESPINIKNEASNEAPPAENELADNNKTFSGMKHSEITELCSESKPHVSKRENEDIFIGTMFNAGVKKIKFNLGENLNLKNTDISEKSFLTASEVAKADVTDSKESVSSPINVFSPASDEVKKRKLEETDNVETDNIETDSKKTKLEDEKNVKLNLFTDESSASDASVDFALKNTKIEELVSDLSVADCKAIDKINQLLPMNPSQKIKTSKKVLDKIALFVCQTVVKDCFKKSHDQAKNQVKELEKKFETLSKDLESFRSQASDFHVCQRNSFSEKNFVPKVATKIRTVGVNVKIYRESELKQAMAMQNSLNKKPIDVKENAAYKQETKPPDVPKTETLSTSPVKPLQTTSVFVPSPQKTNTVVPPAAIPQQTTIKRGHLPRIIAQANRPVIGPQAVAGFQSIPPPNVTVTNRVLPFAPPRPTVPSTQSVLLVQSNVQSNTGTATGRNSYVDLGKDDGKKGTPNLGVSTPTTTVAKVTVPSMGMPANPNVLVPLRDYLQFAGPKGTVAFQSSQMQRPPISSNLLGSRTVTYFVPPNPGIGGRGIPQYIPPQNQQLQFLLRVTNPASVAPLSSVVNSVSRMPGMPQMSVNSTRMPGMQPQVTSSLSRIPGMQSQVTPSLSRMPSMQPQAITTFSKMPLMQPQATTTFSRMPVMQPQTTMSFSRMPGMQAPVTTVFSKIPGMTQQAISAISRTPGMAQMVTSATRTAGMTQQVTAATKMSGIPQLPSNLPRLASGMVIIPAKHPAPFPKAPQFREVNGRALPPKPSLKGNRNPNGGIVLSWNMCILKQHANIASYQLFAYQETDGPVDSSLWKKVGDVNALPLPMACTLTQFMDKNRYYFTVRAVDVYDRSGPFSDPVNILYEKESDINAKK